ncbi:MAG: hypothetical protein FWD75_06615 [Propionibacteriaceae bacterium]|nr:hypothetical protein [Propionibacteriaceae bacterium]
MSFSVDLNGCSTLTCDCHQCGKRYVTLRRNRVATRRGARTLGWSHMRGGVDWCPRHTIDMAVYVDGTNPACSCDHGDLRRAVYATWLRHKPVTTTATGQVCADCHSTWPCGTSRSLFTELRFDGDPDDFADYLRKDTRP